MRTAFLNNIGQMLCVPKWSLKILVVLNLFYYDVAKFTLIMC